MIDWEKINHLVEETKSKKPNIITIDDKFWAESLDGYLECFRNAFFSKEATTDKCWFLIFFSAIAFCRGVQFQQEELGLKEKHNYPRY